MKVVFLGNNWVGWKIGEWLAKGQAEVVGLVLHAPEKQACEDEIRKALGLSNRRIFLAPSLKEPGTLNAIKDLGADMAVSAYFGAILRPSFLEMFPKGCVNIHPALLPYNKGAHPNVWSIVEGTPAGVTLHYMDEGVDTGPIIAQQEIRVRARDTGKTLYRRLERASLDLFERTWPGICEGNVQPASLIAGNGTFHRVADLASIGQIKSDKLYTGKEIVDLLRARTFEPHPGAYMEVDGKKVFMRLELYYEDDNGKA